MEQFMLANGQKKDLDMVKDYKSGRMDLNMKGIGRMIWLTVRAD